MAYLTAHGVAKEFSGVSVLDDVDIEVRLGVCHILAGENGAGKSTLVKILTGVQPPSRGELRIDGRDPMEDRGLFDRIAYVPQELSLFRHMTVAENLFMPFTKSGHGGLTLNRARIEADARVLIDEFHINARPHDVVGDLAVPDQQMLQIARAAAQTSFKVLILDEPTSSLTTIETERLFRVLRRLTDSDHAIVFISHKMDEIFELGGEVTVLRNGRRVGHSPMSEITERELVNLMAGSEVNVDAAFQPATPRGEVLMRVDGLSGPGFSDVSFELKQGEILGFAGLVGAGRSEVMQTIFGFRKATGGSVAVDGRPWPLGNASQSVSGGMIYLSEERSLHGIFAQMSVHDNIALSLFGHTARAGFVSRRLEKQAVGEVIDRYGIRTSSPAKHIRFLSGGNQQKAIIGRAIARRPRILIFDEPTKGVDVRTKAQIYAVMRDLAETGTGIVLVSSEISELRRCATRIVTMCRGRVTGTFDAEAADRTSLVSAILGLRETADVRH